MTYSEGTPVTWTGEGYVTPGQTGTVTLTATVVAWRPNLGGYVLVTDSPPYEQWVAPASEVTLREE